MATTIAQPLLWDGSPIAVPCDGERNVQSRQSVLAMGQVSTLRISFLGRSTFTRVLPDGTEDAATWRFELRDKPGAGYSVLFATNSVTVDPVTKEIAVDCSGTYTNELAGALGERPVASFPALLSGYNADGKRAVSVAFPLSVANTTDEEAMPEEAESQLNIVLRLVERVDAIEELIPANASAQNKLATLADVAAAGGKFIVVQTLPSAESADPKAIYLVPRTTSETGNIYDEYVVVEPTTGTYAWEKIGSTEIDLSEYRKAAAQDVIDAGKASTADATLTEQFGEWEIVAAEPITLYWSGVGWVPSLNGQDVGMFKGDESSLSLSWSAPSEASYDIKATRTFGYQLGSQTDKPLAPANDYALKSEIPSVPVKQVKRNGTALTPDSNGAVNVTVPTIPSDIGAATSAQGKKADSAYQKPSGGIPASDIAPGAIPAAQVQANWDETDTSSKAFIQNKPTTLPLVSPDTKTTAVVADDGTVEVTKGAGDISTDSSWNQVAVAAGLTPSDNLTPDDIRTALGLELTAMLQDAITAAQEQSWTRKVAYQNALATPFSATTAYAVGAFCTYGGLLYECTSAHAAGAWNEAHFTRRTVVEKISGKADSAAIAPAFSASSTYAVGDYVTHDSLLYKCTTAVSTAGAWNEANWTAVAVTDEMGGGGGGGGNLPYDAEVEYIEAEYNQYIDTGIPSNTIVSAYGVFMTPTSGQRFYFGARTSQSSGNLSTAFISGYGFRMAYGTNGNILVTSDQTTAWTNAGFYGTTAFYNGVNESYTQSGTPTGLNAYLFTTNNNGTPISDESYVPLRLRSFIIETASGRVRDFIAVRKDGVGCLYDRVSQTFFYNANSGTGSFAYGADIDVDAYATNEEVEAARNLLAYTSGATLAPGTAIYRSTLNADGTFPTVDATGIPTAAAYYQFELELTVPSTVPSTITGPSGWTWIDGHGLPDPADLSGGETICISVRLDCTARTFLASVWRVA